ncbi:hypothetical protein B566_EDAN010460 [Ephemera danica]|nr:hypothetical protein B566_EDAN010460 [Ephemera danica]
MDRLKLTWQMSRRFASNFLNYKDIPSPKAWPIIGHAHLFGPKGPYKIERLTEAFGDLSKKYGPIFRLRLGPQDMLMTTDADDARTLFQHEGKKPFRPPFPALVHYRQKTFGSCGIVPGNGDEWYHFRPAVNPLLKPQMVHSYWSRQQDIAEAFALHIEKIRGPQNVVTDLNKLITKYTIEAISMVSPGERFRCLEETERAEKIRQANDTFMEGLYETLMEPPVWKVFKTSGYRKLAYAHETIHDILSQSLNEARGLAESPQWQQEQPFMAEILGNKSLSWDDKTATTLVFSLHLLSLDSKRQARAREEAKLVTKEADPKNLRLPFLRSCLKETLRLFPTAGGNTRKLAESTSMVSAVSPISSRMEKYFPKAEDFIPERWLREGDGGPAAASHHPFASLPFGHGPRMCPGRRLAEQEMLLLLAEVLKHYELVRVDTEPLGMVTRMNRVPDRVINLKFNTIA